MFILLPLYVYNMHQDTKSARLIAVCKRSFTRIPFHQLYRGENGILFFLYPTILCAPTLSRVRKVLWLHVHLPYFIFGIIFENIFKETC